MVENKKVGYKNLSEIKKLVAFYNDCISNNTCIEADNDLKNVFIDMSEDIIRNKLQIIWEPDFIYNDETQVYRVENTNVIIVDGYFEDDSVKSKSKIHYNLVFVDCEYYMSCINNMICWEKVRFGLIFILKKIYKVLYKKIEQLCSIPLWGGVWKKLITMGC